MATATVATLAKLFNLTERRVRGLGLDGIIPRPQDGKYDLVGSVQGYVKYLQGRAEGRGIEDQDVHAERARLVRAQAYKTEMEIASLERSLLSVDEVVDAWEQLVGAFRAKCLALPSKLAARLAVIHETRKIQAALTAAVREALQELSQFDLARTGVPDRAQGGTGGNSPAGANGKSMGRRKLTLKPGGQRRARTVPVH
jgi:phage terminase Nu1 subunit (DNA packaging protein)